MKRLLLLLIPVLVFFLFSCDKGPNEPEKIIPADSLQVSSSGMADSFRVTAGFSYSIRIIPAGTAWLQVQLNNTTPAPWLVFLVQPNTGSQPRTATVQLISPSGEIVQSIKVTQEAYTGPVLTTDLSLVSLPGLANKTRALSVQSNISWTISIPPAAAGWLAADQSSGTGNKVIELKTLELYTGAAVRTAQLIITPAAGSGLSPVTVQVNQHPVMINQSWSRLYGGSFPINQFTAIIRTSDNNVLTAGYIGITSATTGWQSDGWLMKHDAQGNPLWQKQYGGSNGDQANAVCTTADGGYVLAGFATSTDGDLAGFTPQNGDYWIVRTDASGNKIWSKAYGGNQFDNAKAVAATPDGGFILCGETSSSDGDVSGNHGAKDIWLLKLDASGQKSWQKCLGGSGDDSGTGVAVLPDGSIVVTAITRSNDGDITGALGGIADGWVVKLSPAGVIQWNRVLGSIFEDEVHAVIVTSAHELVVAGFTSGYLPGWRFNGDMMLVKLNAATGVTLWERAMGSFEPDKAFTLQQTTDGGFLISGFVSQAGADVQSPYYGGSCDAWLVKTDAQAAIEWQKTFGGPYEDKVQGVLETAPDKFILAGVQQRLINTPVSSQSIWEGWITGVNVQ